MALQQGSQLVDFKLFLANEENKRQLCQLLLRVWGSEVAAKRLEKATRSVVVVEGKAYDLESTDGEARIVHAFLPLSEVCCADGVQVSGRTDSGHQHFSHSTSPYTRSTDNHLPRYWDGEAQEGLINVSELAERKGAEYCTVILGLYVFTGEDATSAFKGKGKGGPLKKPHNHQTGDILVMLYVGYVIFLKN